MAAASGVARVIATPIEAGDLARGEQPSLFVAVFPWLQHSYEFKELVRGPHGSIDEAGFASHLADPLSSLPPRNMDFSPRKFYRDRSFQLKSGDCGRHLARVEINEQLVEDIQMRGAIDYTGFEVILTLGTEAFAIYTELAEIEKPRAMSDYRNLVLGIPTPPFGFPAQRGSPKPGDAKIEYVKELRPIKRLEVSEMTVAVVNRRSGMPSETASMLDRFDILSATKLTLGTSA